ncbi:MAG: hypothetical protein R3240_09790 [Gammaproteobacteria bacterium]|nr:hypothetical protein [Gammaproteobacteria bacterium]
MGTFLDNSKSDYDPTFVQVRDAAKIFIAIQCRSQGIRLMKQKVKPAFSKPVDFLLD